MSNRIIKFRAWDSVGKTMFTFDNPFRQWDVSKILDYEIWMQFTGLTDKNGKEIYEGDIISFPKQPKYARTWTVEWQNGGLRLVDGIAYRMLNSDHHGEVGKEGEVIGNIYENPELLRN